MKNNRKNISKAPLHVFTDRSFSIKDRLMFYFTVFTTGAAVMMIELLGTRIIGPFYGVSLVVWTSLLSVALLSLSVGYLVGGRLADRAAWLRLSHIVLLAALSIGVIPMISQPVQLAMDTFGLRAGALVSAFVLFSLPLTLLGMVGPFVIKLATRRLDVLGSTAGNVYAISTLGSVSGTLVLGFFLLPLLGTQFIILTLSVVLGTLALSLAVYEYKVLKVGRFPAPVSATVAVLVFLQLAGAASGQDAEQRGFKVLFEEETHYGWVRVVDQPEEGIRWLMSDSSTIGAEDLLLGTSLLRYQQIVGLIPWFNPSGTDALLIGLGSGHLVNTLFEYGVRTDTIEIDPAVAKAAQEYFSYKPTGELYVGDARYQIKQIEKRYDFIIHDCFTGGAEPIHLLSREMINELKTLLKPGGILALNFVGFTVEHDEAPVASVARTLDQEFTHRRTFVSAPDAEFNDFIFLVSDAPIEFDQSHGNVTAEAKKALVRLEESEVVITGEGGVIITDDYNPLEMLQLAKAEHYRNVLLERVGEEMLFR